MKYSVIVSVLTTMVMTTYAHDKPESSAPCSDAEKASAAPVYSHLPSAAPVYASSWGVPPPPKGSPIADADSEDDCPCKKKAKPSSYYAPAAPTGSVVPHVPPPSNGTVPYTPSNYTTPTNTYIPAQQTTNAGARHGPAVAGVVGLAAVLALL